MVIISQDFSKMMLHQDRRGAIVNIGSVVSERAIGKRTAHCASKMVIDAFPHSMAINLSLMGIIVNNSATNYTHLRLRGVLDKNAKSRKRVNVPLAWETNADDMDKAAAFLVSGDAGFITGGRLLVDSGSNASLYFIDNDA